MGPWNGNVSGHPEWSGGLKFSPVEIINHISLSLKDRKNERKEETPLQTWTDIDEERKSLKEQLSVKQEIIDSHKESLEAKNEFIKLLRDDIQKRKLKAFTDWGDNESFESCDCTSVNVGDEYQATLEGYKEAIKAKDELIAILKENIAIMEAQLSVKWNQDATFKTMNEHG